MSLPDPAAPGNAGSPQNPWTGEVRRQAWIAVRIAATGRRDDRVLGYYLRSALAHGLTFDQCCEAGNLPPETVQRLTDPAVTA